MERIEFWAFGGTPLRRRVVHPLRHLFAVALANSGIRWEEGLELCDIGRRKDDLARRDVAFEVRNPLRPWNGSDVVALGENPGEGHL